MNVNYKKIVLALLFLLVNYGAFSQWTCRSQLAAHMKPIYKKIPLLWAAEFTGGYGQMNDREIANMMVFLGLDYSFGKNQFYFEAGRKSWRNTLDKVNKNTWNKQRFGIREGYYKYFNTNTKLTAGFQQLNAGDYFLVSERGLGLNLKQNLGRFDIDVNAASVLKDFSRFGSFCSVQYLYNVVRDRHMPYLGENIGDSNFSSIALKYTPSKSKREKKSEEKSSEDEFEDFGSKESTTNDEFSDFSDASDEFEDVESSDSKSDSKFSNFIKNKLINETGIVLYNEFGKGVDTSKIYAGGFVDFTMPLDFSLKTELLHQQIVNQQALIYHVKLTKTYKWKKGNRSSITLAYYGKLNETSEEAKAQMSFSNLFIGEVMRLDAYDMPLYQLALKHNFPKIKTHIKFQAVKQMKDNQISELNLAFGKTFYKRAKLTFMFSKMEANSLAETFYMGRFELRITI